MLSVCTYRARDGQETFIDSSEGVALAYSHTATFGLNKDVPSWHQDETVVAAVDGDVYEAASRLQGRTSDFNSTEAGAIVASFDRDAVAFPRGLDGSFSFFL